MSDKPKKEKKAKKPKKEKLPKPSNKKMKICPNCKTEIPKKAKVCPSCAAKQKGKSPLILIIPLILLLLIGGAVSVFAFHFPIDPPVELPLDKLPFEIPFLSGPKISETVLGQGMELTAKQEEAVADILNQCGFKKISKVTRLTSDSSTTSYAVQDVDTERFMSAADPIVVRLEDETKTVHSIVFRNNTVYADETVVSQITDYYMDMSERDRYMQTALDEVKARLDLPEVAVFPSRSHWNFYEDEGGVLIVESYVTTKDGTGTESVRNFLARFENGKFVSLTFSEAES